MSRNYVLLSDVHATRRPPSSCTETYLEDLLTLLGQVLRLCTQRKAVALIIAGDLFDSKVPSRTPHELVQVLMRLFRSSSCPVYVVPGNHDMQNDRVESIDSTQPLGVLFESGAVRRLEGWHGENNRGDELPLFGVPWQQEWSEEGLSELLAKFRGWVTGHGSQDNCLAVAHAPIYPPGKELPWENTPAQWWADAMGNRGSIFYGHVHEPHGVFEVGGVTFCNNGALSRGSLHEYNLERPVLATVWDEETGKFEAVSLDYKPASEVFRLREKAKAVDSEVKLAGFLETIGHAQLEVMSVESVVAYIDSLDIDPEVKALAKKLLEDARHAK